MVRHLAGLIGIALIIGVGGCGKKADENKPIEDVRSEAKSMDNDDLREMAEAYTEAILAKKDDLRKLGQKIKEIPITEVLGKEAEALKEDVARWSKSVSALTDRFQIYYDQLKSQNGNTSGLDIR